MQELTVTNRDEWRDWLAANHQTSTGVWLVFFKKESGAPSLKYEEAVEEALCFGWIDSIIKKRDAESYVRKVTPRKPKSRWSESNKRRVGSLIRRGLMCESGLAKVAEAKESGQWDQSDRPTILFAIPDELNNALAQKRTGSRVL